MEWITNLLSGLFYGPFYAFAYAIWNGAMAACTGLMGTTPEGFSPAAWEYLEDTLYPWATGIGVALMNLFFLIAFCRAASNFKENITLELCIESMVRLVVLNILLQKGFDLISTIFKIASLMSTEVMQMEHLAFYTSDADVGAHLFWWLFGMLYFLVVAVCSIMIILVLYGRYLKLYVLVVFFPFAMPSLVAGRGVDSTAYAWVKTFISNVFEIVVIALVMSIASMIISGGLVKIDAPQMMYFDGGTKALNSLISIVLLTAAVKGTSSFLNKSFGL